MIWSFFKLLEADCETHNYLKKKRLIAWLHNLRNLHKCSAHISIKRQKKRKESIIKLSKAEGRRSVKTYTVAVMKENRVWSHK